MVDPVVSSKYGKRPLLEMPAMLVDTGPTRLEVSSLQPTRPAPEFESPAFIYRPDGLSNQQMSMGSRGRVSMPGMVVPGAGVPMTGGMMGAQPMFQQPLLQQPTSMMSPMTMAPPQPGYSIPSMDPQAMTQQPMIPQSMGQFMMPQPMVPQSMAPPMVPQSMAQPMVPPSMGQPMAPQQMQMPSMYPGVHPPFQGQGYYAPGGMPPQGAMPHYPLPPPPQTPVPENFRLEGVLEYGQLTTIHFKEKNSHFRGVPSFLLRELQKSYGKFPTTDIRIMAINGEFHIYATPRQQGEGEFLDPIDPAGTDPHMIGFNEVRGEPRDGVARR